jgi:hypothetical protein
MNTSAVRLISSDDSLFEYPIPLDATLESHSFFAFHHRQYQASDFRDLASNEVRGVALDLLCAAQDQKPVGTLPTEEALLAKKAKQTLEQWRLLMSQPVTPLHEWRRCRCEDGTIRLYNPELLKVTFKAIAGRDKVIEDLASDRERKRLKELPDKVRRAGGSERMAQDMAYLVQLDQFLVEHYPNRNRVIGIMREAMEALDLARGA